MYANAAFKMEKKKMEPLHKAAAKFTEGSLWEVTKMKFLV